MVNNGIIILFYFLYLIQKINLGVKHTKKINDNNKNNK